MPATRTTRPISISLAAVLLGAIALLSLAIGSALTWLSGGIFVQEPLDWTPLQVGLAAAVCAGFAVMMLWSGGPAYAVLAGAAVPVGVATWAVHDGDLDLVGPLLLLLLAGLTGLAVACRSRSWRAWLWSGPDAAAESGAASGGG